MVYYTIKLLVIKKQKNPRFFGESHAEANSPDMQILGNTALRATHVPCFGRSEWRFLVWSMGKYGATGKIYKKPSGSHC